MVEGAAKDKSKNTMRDLHIRKLCLNICVGESLVIGSPGLARCWNL